MVNRLKKNVPALIDIWYKTNRILGDTGVFQNKAAVESYISEKLGAQYGGSSLEYRVYQNGEVVIHSVVKIK